MSTFANSDPATIFNKQVSFSTVDLLTNTPVTEGYSVSSPSSTGIVVVPLSSTKVVIPLTTTSGDGAPYLKIHLPTGAGNKMYVTFCVKSSAMADGYYDYKTGIPSAYRTALKSWIAGSSILIPTGTVQRRLKFTSYGISTNKPAEAITFYVSFQGVFAISGGVVVR